ncbi:hypothetical protein ACEPAG_6239 [Sanghuangporus baumii]
MDSNGADFQMPRSPAWPEIDKGFDAEDGDDGNVSRPYCYYLCGVASAGKHTPQPIGYVTTPDVLCNATSFKMEKGNGDRDNVDLQLGLRLH